MPITSIDIPRSCVRELFIVSGPGRLASAADIRTWLLSWFKESEILGTRGERWMRDEVHHDGPFVRETLVRIAKTGGGAGLTHFFLGCGFDEAVAVAFAEDVWLAIISWI